MTHPPAPQPPSPPSGTRDALFGLSTPLLVVFSLLMCCGLPILPIYLWRKGKIPGWAGIGIAVAWVSIYAVIAVAAAELEVEPDPDHKAKVDPSETPTSKAPSPTPAPTPSDPTPTVDPADEERHELVQRAEELVMADLPDAPIWEGVTAKGLYVSDTEVCVDRTYGPTGGVGGEGGNAGFVVVKFPSEELSEPQDGTCATESRGPEPQPSEVDVPAELEDDPGLLVSTEYGDKWPLVVPYGVAECEHIDAGGRQLQAITFLDPSGKRWAVNGTAQSHTQHPEIRPIWADDPDIDGAKIDISPIIDKGFEVCE